jgi:hypothetical protein
MTKYLNTGGQWRNFAHMSPMKREKHTMRHGEITGFMALWRTSKKTKLTFTLAVWKKLFAFADEPASDDKSE